MLFMSLGQHGPHVKQFEILKKSLGELNSLFIKVKTNLKIQRTFINIFTYHLINRPYIDK